MLTEFEQNRIKRAVPGATIASSLRQNDLERNRGSQANCYPVKPTTVDLLLEGIKSVTPYRRTTIYECDTVGLE